MFYINTEMCYMTCYSTAAASESMNVDRAVVICMTIKSLMVMTDHCIGSQYQ